MTTPEPENVDMNAVLRAAPGRGQTTETEPSTTKDETSRSYQSRVPSRQHLNCDDTAWRPDLGDIIGLCRCFCHAPRIVRTVAVERGTPGTA
jgi:hypothetical protein